MSDKLNKQEGQTFKVICPHCHETFDFAKRLPKLRKDKANVWIDGRCPHCEKNVGLGPAV